MEKSLSGAKVRKSCKISTNASKECLLPKIGFDADENEPSEVFAAAKPIQYREKEPFYRTPAFLGDSCRSKL